MNIINFLMVLFLNNNLGSLKRAGGEDSRPLIKPEPDILVIKTNFEKLKLLKILQDNKVSQVIKLNLIEQNDSGVKPFNILAGGLYKDFDFDF